jgi:hypothetical protein
MVLIQKHHLEMTNLTKEQKLENWIDSEIKKAKENKEPFFLNYPDSWYKSATWADINGHISKSYLSSEEEGCICLECQEPVWLCPPETTEEQLKEILSTT